MSQIACERGMHDKWDKYNISEFVSAPNFSARIPLNTYPEYPKISIVMPSFNQQRFIERSILSVLNQNYPNIELIVVDGGSTDGTVEILKKYDNHIAHWVSESDGGQSDALNKGFSRATGEIYGWLNSDDIYLPLAFDSAVAAFNRFASAGIVYSDWLSIDVDDRVIAYDYAFDFNLDQLKYEGASINAQAMFWRRDVHRRFGVFDRNFHSTMDYQMVLVFGINEGSASFLRLPAVFGAFRRYDSQKTGNFRERVHAEHVIMAQRYGYSDKYSAVGKIKRLFYRVRRLWWYTKRGGVNYLFVKIVRSQAFSGFLLWRKFYQKLPSELSKP